MTTWDAKDPDEVLVCTFDFSEEVAAEETISAATVTCTVQSGADEDPAQLVESALPAISGATVLQRLTAGVDGARYALRCTATLAPTGRVLVLAATLPVRRA